MCVRVWHTVCMSQLGQVVYSQGQFVYIWKHFKVQRHSRGLTSIVAAKMPVTHIVLLISSCLVFTTLLTFMLAACAGTTFMLKAVSTSSVCLCLGLIFVEVT